MLAQSAALSATRQPSKTDIAVVELTVTGWQNSSENNGAGPLLVGTSVVAFPCLQAHLSPQVASASIDTHS